jgi:aryl-alcohol dehydrogenase-like predicted oxidoreductase
MFGWQIGERASIDIIHQAVRRGIRLLDTADTYAHGGSEVIVGRALRGLRTAGEVVVATKVFGPVGDNPHDRGLAPGRIRRACDASLARLGIDRIDLYQLHRPDPEVPIAETIGAMAELVREGKVGRIGTSTFPEPILRQAVSAAASQGIRISTEQAPYSLLEREAERAVIPFCKEHSVQVLAWGPLAGGLLTGKYTPGQPPPLGSRYMRWKQDVGDTPAVRAASQLAALARSAGLEPAQLAIGWLGSRAEVAAILAGPRTLAQLDAYLSAAAITPSRSVLEAVDAVVGPGQSLVGSYREQQIPANDGVRTITEAEHAHLADDLISQPIDESLEATMKLGTVLDHHSADAPPVGGNVTEEAIKREWIIPFGRGQFLYAPPWVRLLRHIHRMILTTATEEHGFSEWMFPRLIPRAALDSFELTAYRPDMLLTLGDDMALDPVQCISFYESLRGQAIPDESLPIRAVETLGGWTWRNERLEDLDGPIKSTEFSRVEHVYIGTPQQVRDTRMAVRCGLTSILTELGLSWQVVAAEGCMELPSIIEAQEAAVTADDIPVQDIEIPLSDQPHPSVDVPSWAADFDQAFDLREISGCSVEGDHLTRNFRLRSVSGEEIWSGCCGMGMNRLVVGFLYQNGFDASQWPSSVGAADAIG